MAEYFGHVSQIPLLSKFQPVIFLPIWHVFETREMESGIENLPYFGYNHNLWGE